MVTTAKDHRKALDPKGVAGGCENRPPVARLPATERASWRKAASISIHSRSLMRGASSHPHYRLCHTSDWSLAHTCRSEGGETLNLPACEREARGPASYRSPLRGHLIDVNAWEPMESWRSTAADDMTSYETREVGSSMGAPRVGEIKNSFILVFRIGVFEFGRTRTVGELRWNSRPRS